MKSNPSSEFSQKIEKMWLIQHRPPRDTGLFFGPRQMAQFTYTIAFHGDPADLQRALHAAKPPALPAADPPAPPAADPPALPAADPPALPAADPPALPAAKLPGKNAKNNIRQKANRRLNRAKLAAENEAAGLPPPPGTNAGQNKRQRQSRQRKKGQLAQEQKNQLAAEEDQPAAEEDQPAAEEDQLAQDPPPGMLAEPNLALPAMEVKVEPNLALPAMEVTVESEPPALLPSLDGEEPDRPPREQFKKSDPALPSLDGEEPDPASPAMEVKGPDQASYANAAKKPNQAHPKVKEDQKEPNQASLAAAKIKEEPKPAVPKYVRPDRRGANAGPKCRLSPEAKAAREAKEELAKTAAAAAQLKADEEKKRKDNAKEKAAHMKVQRKILIDGAKKIAESDSPGSHQIVNLMNLLYETNSLTESTMSSSPVFAWTLSTILSRAGAFSRLDWNWIFEKFIESGDKLTPAGKGACILYDALWRSDVANSHGPTPIPEISELADFARCHSKGAVSRSDIEQALTHDALTRTGGWGSPLCAGAALTNVQNMREILSEQLGRYELSLSDNHEIIAHLSPILEGAKHLIENHPDLTANDDSVPEGLREEQLNQLDKLIENTTEGDLRQLHIDRLGLRKAFSAVEEILKNWDDDEAENQEKIEDFLQYFRGVCNLLVSVGGIDSAHIEKVKKFFSAVVSDATFTPSGEMRPVPPERIAYVHGKYGSSTPNGCVLSQSLDLFMYSEIEPGVLECLTGLNSSAKEWEDVRYYAPPGAVSAVALRPPLTAKDLADGPSDMDSLKRAAIDHFKRVDPPPSNLWELRLRWVDDVQTWQTSAGKYKTLESPDKPTMKVLWRHGAQTCYEKPEDFNPLCNMLEDIRYAATLLQSDIARANKCIAELSKLQADTMDNLSRLSVLTPAQRDAIIAYAKAEEELRLADVALEKKTQEDAAQSKEAKARKDNALRNAMEFFLKLCASPEDATLAEMFDQTCEKFPQLERRTLRAYILTSELGEELPKGSTPPERAISLASNFDSSLNVSRRDWAILPKFAAYALTPPRNSETLRYSKDLRLGDLATSMNVFLALGRMYGFVAPDNGITPERYLRLLQDACNFRFAEHGTRDVAGVYTRIVGPFMEFMVDNFSRLSINQFRDGTKLKYKVRSFLQAPANSAVAEFKEPECAFTADVISRFIGAVQRYTEEARAAISIPRGYYDLIQKLSSERIPPINNTVPAEWVNLIESSGFSLLPEGDFDGPRVSFAIAASAIKTDPDRAGSKGRNWGKLNSAKLKRLGGLAAETQNRDVQNVIRDIKTKYPEAKNLLACMEVFRSSRARVDLEAECDEIAARISSSRRDGLVAKLEHYLRTGVKLSGLLSLDNLLPQVNTKIIDAMSAEKQAEWVQEQTKKILEANIPDTPESKGLRLIYDCMEMIDNPIAVFLLHSITGGDMKNLKRAAELFTKNPSIQNLQATCDSIRISAVPVLLALDMAGAKTPDGLTQRLFQKPATQLAGMINAGGRVGSAVARLVGQAFDEVRRNMDPAAIGAADAYVKNSLREVFGDSLPQRRRTIFESFFENLARAYDLPPRKYVHEAQALFAQLPQEFMFGNYDILSRAVVLLANAERTSVDLIIAVFNGYRGRALVAILKLIVLMYKESHASVPVRVLDASDPDDAATLFSDSRAERYGIFVGDAWTRAGDLTLSLMRDLTYAAFIGLNYTDCPSMVQIRAAMESKQVIPKQENAPINWKGKRNNEGESIIWSPTSQKLTCTALLAAGIQRGNLHNILYMQPISNQYCAIVVPGRDGPNITLKPSFREFAINPPIVTSILTFPDTDDSYSDDASNENYLDVR